MGMLGWAIPFGIGAQVALPKSKVIVFAGDGSFGFNGMEIDTAVRHKIPVVILIGNDSVWGIDYHQQKKFFGKSVATELLPDTRYDLVAKALGAHGEFVETLSELEPALKRAFSSNKPAVVNVRTMPSPSPLTKWVLDTKLY
jgi:acetolactate synthase-1/2/3 large subunit